MPYLPDTLSMAPMFVYDIMGERVAYSCFDIRAEMKRMDRRYRGGDHFLITQPRYLLTTDFNYGREASETIDTMTLRVREFRHGRSDAREPCGEFKDKADEARYLAWYPELRPDWETNSSIEAKVDVSE